MIVVPLFGGIVQTAWLPGCMVTVSPNSQVVPSAVFRRETVSGVLPRFATAIFPLAGSMGVAVMAMGVDVVGCLVVIPPAQK